jgi:hypothetical protein
MQTFLPTDTLALIVTLSCRLNEVFRIEKLLKFQIFFRRNPWGGFDSGTGVRLVNLRIPADGRIQHVTRYGGQQGQ